MNNFWKSSNFWTALVLLIGGLFVGFPAEVGQEVVTHVLGLVAAGKTMHDYFKEAKLDFRGWLLDSNTFAYLGIIITAGGLPLPQEVLGALQELIRQLFGGGNLNNILIAAFALATILFNFIRGRSSLLPKLA